MIDDLFISKVREVDGLADDRVHNAVRRQRSELPAIAVTRVSGSDTRGMGGELIGGSAQYRVDVYAETHGSLLPIIEQVKAALGGFRGWLSNTCRAHLVTVNGPSDFSDDEGDLKLRHQILDVDVIYSEE